MSFFKKALSRSRGNSYAEDDYLRSPPQSAGGHNPPSAYQSPGAFPDESAHRTPPGATLDSKDADNMYANQPHQQSHPSGGYSAGATRPLNTVGSNPRPAARHDSSTRDSGYADASAPMSPTVKTGHPSLGGVSGGVDSAAAPDLLTRAFNEAVRPFHEKIEQLEQQLADMQDWVQSQEQQRMEIYSWIDKRGLRPDVPPAIAKQMDDTPDAATALNAQLDRKITIVNFDLHRLQDDLNDSISSSHFASAMAKFLPDIQRLARLRQGPRFAYELLIKLVGNLNSHGGIDSGDDTAEDAEDRHARAVFYERMDSELSDVVKRRFEEHDDWGQKGLAGQVKRLDSNAAYLRNVGIDSYFPRSLEIMKRELEYGGSAGSGGMSAGGMNAGHGAAGTPPRYSQDARR